MIAYPWSGILESTILLCALCLATDSYAATGIHADAKPQIFAPDVVSTGSEFTLTFMPDGKEAYFTRRFPDKKLNHIMRTQFADGKWQTPTPISFSSEQWSDLDPSVSLDGKRLFFISTRTAPQAGNIAARDMDIWYAERLENGWGEPRHIENVNSPAKEGSPTVAKDGTLYFFSDRDAAANANSIYYSKLVNGRYTAPVKLGPEINSDASDTSPFISPAGDVLLFYSTRPGGYGKADLYVSFRRGKKWSAAMNLGPSANTEEFEYNPSVSRDGKILYFGRSGNIYEIPLETLRVPHLVAKRFQRPSKLK